ncbi:MAG: SPOR domain-containing protein [Deltaproteobacteria bacterium]|nr:MAG: SPOR domain-containing protein [Deltaproteobacteria bacterium]
MTSTLKGLSLIVCTFIILLLPQLIFSATGPYYYLHVESFRAKGNALQSAQNFQRQGLAAVVKKIRVAKLGDWYRVYIGPFSTRQEAKLKAAELKKLGIVDYAAVQKTDSMIPVTVAIAAPSVKKKRPPTIPQPQPPPPKPPSQPTVASQTARPAAQPKAMEQPVTPTDTKKKPPPAKPKPSKTTALRGKGRNVSGGNVGLGYKHTYREINTELTERLEITTNGGTTITEKPVEDIKNDFPTTMHQDTLFLKLGLTDYFEVYAEGGIAYDELSDPGYVYGGGLRLNLFQTADSSSLPGLYAAIHGAYLTGEFEEEFTSAIDGNKFERETEWWEVSGGVELGISRRRYAVYIGGNYYKYTEETERRQLQNLPPGLTARTFEDELQQENDYGVYGGFTIQFTAALSLNIEGRLIDQESIFGALEYRF